MKRRFYLPLVLSLIIFGGMIPGQSALAAEASKSDKDSKEPTYSGKWVHPIQLNGKRYLPTPSEKTRTISYFSNPEGDFHYTIGEILGKTFYFHKTFVTGEKHKFEFDLETNEIIDVTIEKGEGTKFANKYRIWADEAEEFVAALKKAGSIKKIG